MVANVLFLDGVGNFGSLAEKVKILANGPRGCATTSTTYTSTTTATKGIVIEGIISFV